MTDSDADDEKGWRSIRRDARLERRLLPQAVAALALVAVVVAIREVFFA
ncbi:MAG TPA: hypothetical protein VGC18_07945 [Lacisediminihabitans sp.]